MTGLRVLRELREQPRGDVHEKEVLSRHRHIWRGCKTARRDNAGANDAAILDTCGRLSSKSSRCRG